MTESIRLAVLLAMPTSRATAEGPSSGDTAKQSRIDIAIDTDPNGSSAFARGGPAADMGSQKLRPTRSRLANGHLRGPHAARYRRSTGGLPPVRREGEHGVS